MGKTSDLFKKIRDAKGTFRAKMGTIKVSPAPLFMKFSRQEHWSGLPCPPPGGLPESGIEPVSLMSPALADGFFTTSTIWEAQSFADCP